MDGEIILDRGDSNIMKLDENEQAMMDEIQLDFPRPQTMSRSRPPPGARAPPPPSYQEDIDDFSNTLKQNPPPPPQQEHPIDYGYNEPQEE